MIERLVDMLDVPAGVTHERVALAPERTHAADFGGGAKCAAQQSDGVQVLQPLAVHHIGLAAGHVLHVAGVDQAHLDPGFLQQFRQWNPIHAGRLHGDALNPDGLQPRHERAQVLGEGGETTHGLSREGGRHGDVYLARTDVGAGGVGIDDGLDRLDFGLALAGHGRTSWGAAHRRPRALELELALSQTGCGPRGLLTTEKRERTGTTLTAGLHQQHQSRDGLSLPRQAAPPLTMPLDSFRPSFFPERPRPARVVANG